MPPRDRSIFFLEEFLVAGVCKFFFLVFPFLIATAYAGCYLTSGSAVGCFAGAPLRMRHQQSHQACVRCRGAIGEISYVSSGKRRGGEREEF